MLHMESALGEDGGGDDDADTNSTKTGRKPKANPVKFAVPESSSFKSDEGDRKVRMSLFASGSSGGGDCQAESTGLPPRPSVALLSRRNSNASWDYKRRKSTLLKAYQNVAAKCSQEDEWHTGAIQLFERTKESLEKELGPDHPDLATASNNMGNFLRTNGELDEAMEHYVRAKDLFEQCLGAEHIDTAAVYVNIGNLLQEREEYLEALEFHEQALDIKESEYGMDHPDIGAAYLNMGQILELQGDYIGAVAMFDKALEIWEHLYNEDSDVAYVCEKLAKALQTLGDFHRSLKLHKKALYIWEKSVGANHPNIATTYFNMANILQAEGNVDDAVELYKRALKVCERTLGPNHAMVASICKNMSQVYKSVGDVQNSMDYFDKTLRIREHAISSLLAGQAHAQRKAMVFADKTAKDTFSIEE
ncbi:hypothetical protein BSKO_07732 [Bryopsis sp. KO-2023]|nr:hypothetical protein BSKO_07732 [Bryopsis sp. KO-2023]